MSIRRKALPLANRQVVITQAADSAFLVNTGSVDVCIVPQGGRQSGRRIPVCRAERGDVIPAFCYRDADYQRWAFALVAVGSAELTEMEHAATDPLRAGFLAHAGLVDEAGQGFDDCLVNRYRRIQAMEHGYFVRASRDERDTVRKMGELVGGPAPAPGDAIERWEETPSRIPLDVVLSMPKGQIAGIALLSSAPALAAAFAAAFAKGAVGTGAASGFGLGGTQLAGLALAAVLLVFGVAFAREALIGRAKARSSADAFSEAVRHLFEVPESFLRSCERTQLALLASEASRLAERSVDAVGSIAEGAMGLVLLGMQLCWHSAPLFADVLVLGCVLAGLTYAFASRRRYYDRQAADIGFRADSMLGQFLEGMEKVRTAGIEHRAAHEYLKYYVRQCAARTRSLNIRHVAASVFSFILLAGVLLSCVLHATEGAGDPGILIACAVLSVGFLGAFRALALGIGKYMGLRRSSGRLDELLGQDLEERREGEKVDSLRGAISFEDVSFTYEGEIRPALSSVSFSIDAGESVGIVGRSGCGKSTVLSLILGLESPSEGVVRLDGHDAKALDVRSLRRQIGSVLQDDALIAGSIYENVALANPGASVKAVKHALEAAGMWSEVARMPMGVATIVGEGGCALSGGQVQRILLARALMGHPKILLLDEATSALDGASQEAVRKTLSDLDCTKVIVAHRMEAVADCERIITMDEGRIVHNEQRRHDAAR